jgi:hypothetical protein
MMAAALVTALPSRTGLPVAPVPALTVPTGRPALVDGHTDPGEWSDARVLAAAPGMQLYLKRDAEFLYVAVVRTEPALFGVNLYLRASPSSDAEVDYLNLHASARLGERRGHAGAWPEWTWWNTTGWTASLTRAVSFEERRFLPDTAKEFQIRLDRLPGRAFALSVDVETSQGTAPLLTELPAHDGLHWLTLEL